MPYFGCQNVFAPGLSSKCFDQLVVRIRTPSLWEAALAGLDENRRESWCTDTFAADRGLPNAPASVAASSSRPIRGVVHATLRITDQLRGQRTEESNDIHLSILVTDAIMLKGYRPCGLILGQDFLGRVNKIPSRGLNGRPTIVLDLSRIGCHPLAPSVLQLSP